VHFFLPAGGSPSGSDRLGLGTISPSIPPPAARTPLSSASSAEGSFVPPENLLPREHRLLPFDERPSPARSRRASSCRSIVPSALRSTSGSPRRPERTLSSEGQRPWKCCANTRRERGEGDLNPAAFEPGDSALGVSSHGQPAKARRPRKLFQLLERAFHSQAASRLFWPAS